MRKHVLSLALLLTDISVTAGGAIPARYTWILPTVIVLLYSIAGVKRNVAEPTRRSE